MNTKRAVLMALGAYIASFIVGNIIAVTLGYNPWEGDRITPQFWMVSIVFTILIVAVFALWYFKGPVSANTKEGFHLGIVFLIVGFIIDFVLIVPFIIGGSFPIDILGYYLDPFFWLAIIAMVATTTIIGAWKEQRTQSRPATIIQPKTTSTAKKSSKRKTSRKKQKKKPKKRK